jgi:sortase A
VVAQHRAERILEQTKIAWKEGRPVDAPAAAVLRIPRFGEDWEVPIVEGIDDDALGRGVGWDPETARPGKVGNFVVAGHRVTHAQPFRDFPSLEPGDRVYVDVPAPGRATGVRTYTYRLRHAGGEIRVDAGEDWPLWPVPSPTARGTKPVSAVITLITCAELWHTDGRNVVIGELMVSAVPRG